MSDLVSIFKIDWKLLIAQIVNFALVMWLISHFVMKPLVALMEKRKKDIQSGIDNFTHSETIVHQSKDEAKTILHNAEVEASQIRSKAQEEYNAKIQDTKQELAKLREEMLAQAKKAIEEEKNSMMKAFKAESVDIVIHATEKIIGKELGESNQSRKHLVTSYIESQR
jgi:F-type H+-transporting ATPase subunit b